MQWFLQKSKYDFFNGDARLSCTCISEDRNINIFWTGFFFSQKLNKTVAKRFFKKQYEVLHVVLYAN